METESIWMQYANGKEKALLASYDQFSDAMSVERKRIRGRCYARARRARERENG